MTFMTSNHSWRCLTAALSAAVLALGLSGTASAHGADSGHGRGDGYDGYRSERTAVVEHHYYNESPRKYRKKGRGHGRGYSRRPGRRHGHNPRKVVYVHEHYEPVVEVVQVREYYEPRSRVVERPVVRNSYGYERSDSNSGGGPRINAGSLMGAAIGGLIGAQIGGGSGKLAATAAGSVGGLLLGDHATRGYR